MTKNQSKKQSFAYSPELLKFFRGLKKNPNKIWYEKNKDLYKLHYQEASLRLISQLGESPEFQALGLRGSQRGSLFRIHRDVRFSKNKSPYKTGNGVLMSRGATKDEAGVFYLHIEPSKCFMAVGFWQPDPKLLASFRNWIVDHSEMYLALDKKLRSRKLKFDEEDSLKRLPRGFQHVQDEQLARALKRRHFVITQEISDTDLSSAKLTAQLRSFVKRAAPLLLWGWSLEEGL